MFGGTDTSTSCFAQQGNRHGRWCVQKYACASRWPPWRKARLAVHTPIIDISGMRPVTTLEPVHDL
jgi:hypothetical protein